MAESTAESPPEEIEHSDLLVRSDQPAESETTETSYSTASKLEQLSDEILAELSRVESIRDIFKKHGEAGAIQIARKILEITRSE